MSTSAAPPVAVPHPAVNARYALPTLPLVPAASPDTLILDAFKLAVAKLVGKAWEEDPAKIFTGVDTGMSHLFFRIVSDHLGKKGADLAVAIARFKKGNPAEWGQRVLNAVSCPLSSMWSLLMW